MHTRDIRNISSSMNFIISHYSLPHRMHLTLLMHLTQLWNYRISSNNSRPSINHLLRIIPPPAPPLTNIGNPLSIPIAVNLEDEAVKRSLIQQNWLVMMPRILTMKINQGCDVIIFFIWWENSAKYLRHDFQRTIYIWNNRLPWITAFPRLIAHFWCEKRNSRPRLLLEETGYVTSLAFLQHSENREHENYF